MSVFKRISVSDSFVVPYSSNKTWNISSADITDLQININKGVNLNNSIFSPSSETTYNNQYPRLVYNTVNNIYYPDFLPKLINTGSRYGTIFNDGTLSTSSYNGHSDIVGNINTIKYFPTESNSVIYTIDIPRQVAGDRIFPSTFELSYTKDGGAYKIYDDGNYNLRHSGSNLVSSTGIILSQSSYIGNIFYEQNTAIITNVPNLITSSFFEFINNINFKNDYTVYENFIKCTIKNYEFNGSYNPTLLSGSQGLLIPYSSSISSSKVYVTSEQNYGILKDFATSSISGSESSFSPYVSSIGLYNDDQDLVAVAKMSTPIPISSNTDMTFLVKWDTNFVSDLPPSSFNALILGFDDIINVPVSNPSNINEWNTFFSLPEYGNPFVSASVDGNNVYLYNNGNISLKDFIFSDNYSLSSVIDSGIITLANSYCFNNCFLLTTVDFPNLTKVGDGCFQNCQFTTLDLPLLITAGDYGFYNCPLTTVNIPLLSSAGAYCFSGLQSPTLNLPSLITAGDYCFYACASTIINILNLTTAGIGCFSSCPYLTNLNLPSLIYAGTLCFSNCLALTTVDLSSFISSPGGSMFVNCSNLTTINLPKAEVLGGYTFANTAITSLDLPNLTYAIEYCFYNCSLLTYLNIPKCSNLGNTTGYDHVFEGINNNIITLYITSSIQTCNSGNPDGDIQDLLTHNPGSTIYYV